MVETSYERKSALLHTIEELFTNELIVTKVVMFTGDGVGETIYEEATD